MSAKTEERSANTNTHGDITAERLARLTIVPAEPNESLVVHAVNESSCLQSTELPNPVIPELTAFIKDKGQLEQRCIQLEQDLAGVRAELLSCKVELRTSRQDVANFRAELDTKTVELGQLQNLAETYRSNLAKQDLAAANMLAKCKRSVDEKVARLDANKRTIQDLETRIAEKERQHTDAVNFCNNLVLSTEQVSIDAKATNKNLKDHFDLAKRDMVEDHSSQLQHVLADAQMWQRKYGEIGAKLTTTQVRMQAAIDQRESYLGEQISDKDLIRDMRTLRINVKMLASRFLEVTPGLEASEEALKPIIAVFGPENAHTMRAVMLDPQHKKVRKVFIRAWIANSVFIDILRPRAQPNSARDFWLPSDLASAVSSLEEQLSPPNSFDRSSHDTSPASAAVDGNEWRARTCYLLQKIMPKFADEESILGIARRAVSTILPWIAADKVEAIYRDVVLFVRKVVTLHRQLRRQRAYWKILVSGMLTVPDWSLMRDEDGESSDDDDDEGEGEKQAQIGIGAESYVFGLFPALLKQDFESGKMLEQEKVVEKALVVNFVPIPPPPTNVASNDVEMSDPAEQETSKAVGIDQPSTSLRRRKFEKVQKKALPTSPNAVSQTLVSTEHVQSATTPYILIRKVQSSGSAQDMRRAPIGSPGPSHALQGSVEAETATKKPSPPTSPNDKPDKVISPKQMPTKTAGKKKGEQKQKPGPAGFSSMVEYV